MKTVWVRKWDSSKWEEISETAWREAEKKAGKVSAFAETREYAPSGY